MADIHRLHEIHKHLTEAARSFKQLYPGCHQPGNDAHLPYSYMTAAASMIESRIGAEYVRES